MARDAERFHSGLERRPFHAGAGGRAGQPPDQALSVYDTSPLTRALEDLIDFAFLNREERVRLSCRLSQRAHGNSIDFDNGERKLGPEHVMASGFLPPGFPPVMIAGHHYWDGGVVSNSSLWYVLDDSPNISALIVQVDLFSAKASCRSTWIRCSSAKRHPVLEPGRKTCGVPATDADISASADMSAELLRRCFVSPANTHYCGQA